MHKLIITAAANRVKCYNKGELVKELILVDNCHYGQNMRQIYKLLDNLYDKVETSNGDDQGFVDCHGKYYNRREAYKIASTSGQYFNEEYVLFSSRDEPELDSSCIRHFREDKLWEDYKV
ncbi:MAG: hypothetical protein GY928_28715 [Colwellia sp.]|nr:hypothetical protein [Colwellia sp.]